MSAEPLKNVTRTAAALGLNQSQITRLMQAGVITPEIHEGRLIRFDVEKVRRQLRKRAAANLKSEPIPNGMVPTY